MLLTSSVKELEAILQKLINLNLDWSTMTMKNINVDGDADEPRSGDVGRGLGATTETNKFVLSQELEKWENKAVLSLCLDG